MVVENQTPPAQPASSRLVLAKDVALIVSGLGGFSVVLITALALVMSMTVAPLRDDLRLMRQEMRSGFEAVDADFKAVDDEFKAVRKDLADLSERLARLETLLEQLMGQSPAPPPADAE